MDAVAAAPAHELLQRKDKADSHSTRPAKSATASLLSDYSFGSADDTGSRKTENANSAKPVQGSMAVHNPLVAHSAGTLSVLQSLTDTATAAPSQKTTA